MSDTWSHDIKATRKPCKCFGCSREIPAGSRVRAVTQKQDGKWERINWCPVCDAYWSRYMDVHDEIWRGELRSEDPEGWEAVRVELEAQETAK